MRGRQPPHAAALAGGLGAYEPSAQQRALSQQPVAGLDGYNMGAPLPPYSQPSVARPSVRGAPTGGLRHPKLWMTSAQAAHGPQQPMPPTGLVDENRHRANSKFTSEFAPRGPSIGGGFVFGKA